MWDPGGRRGPSSPLCTRNVGRRFADRARGALAQHGAHSSAFPANAVRLTLQRAALRDIALRATSGTAGCWVTLRVPVSKPGTPSAT